MVWRWSCWRTVFVGLGLFVLAALMVPGVQAQATWVGAGVGGEVVTSQVALPTGAGDWTSQTIAPGGHLYGVAHGDGVWIAVGLDCFVGRSTDGMAWKQVAVPSSCDKRMFNVATDGQGNWVAVGSLKGDPGNVLRSTDGGLTWSYLPGVDPDNSFRKIATDGSGHWVALGYEGVAAWSDDNGATWNPMNNEPWLAANLPSGTYDGHVDTHLYAVAHDPVNGVWCAGGSYARWFHSTDGTTWTYQGDAMFGDHRNIQHMAYADGEWIASGSRGVTRLSSDCGTSWSNLNHPFGTSEHLYAVGALSDGCGGTSWVSGGTNDVSGTFAYRTTGTWSSASWPFASTRLWSVAGASIGLPEATTTTIEASPAKIFADGTSTSTITVTVRDASGVQIPCGGHNVELSASEGTLSSTTPVDNGDGTYTATLTSDTKIVTSQVTGKLDGQPITDDALVDFVAGAASPATTTIDAADASLPADGAAMTKVTVTLYDDAGLRNKTGGLNVELFVDPGEGSLSSVTDHGDGTYTATLTAGTTPGIATVTGRLEGVDIADDAQVDLLALAPDPDQSTLEATPHTIAADGVATSNVVLTLKDDQGNALPQGGHNVQITSDAGAISGVTDRNDGTYEATLTAPTAVGKATLKAVVEGQSVPDEAEVEFVPGPPDLDQSTLEATPARIAADGQASSLVTLTLVDAHANRILGAGVDIQADQGDLTAVTAQGDGTYTAKLSGTYVGIVLLRATVDGQDLTDEAEVELFSIVPDPKQSLLHVSPDSIRADGVEQSTVTVTLRNGQGDPTGQAEHTVTVHTDRGDLTGVVDHGDGTYSAKLTGTTVGVAVVTAHVDGALLDAQRTVELLPGPPVAGRSTIEADPPQIPADGSTASTITLRLRDANDNPVAGHPVSFATDLGDLEPVLDLGDGTYEAVLRGLDPGTATVASVLGLGAQVEFMVPDGPLAVLLAPGTMQCIDEPVPLQAVAHHGGEPVQKWVFDLGGSVLEVAPDAERPHRVGLEHMFAGPGTKAVKVTAHFEEATPHDAGEIHVVESCREPVVRILHDVSGLEVGFEDVSLDPDEVIEAWHWDFGDGATSNERHPEHTYAAYGTYLVRLVVTDVLGREAFGEKVVVLTRPAEPEESAGAAAHAVVEEDAADPDPEVVDPEGVDPEAGAAATEGDPRGEAPRDLTADFTIHQEAPDLFRFVADVPPEATRVLWSFSDGGTAEGKEVQRLFEPGQHHATLRVEGEGQVVESVQFLRASAEPEGPEELQPVLPADEAEPAQFQETDVQQQSSLGGVGWWVVGGLGLAVLLALLVLVVLLRRPVR